MNIDKKLIEAAESKNAEKLSEVMDEISLSISKAINPISHFSAPFIVSCLRRQASTIENLYPGIREVVKDIDECFGHTAISIPVPRSNQEATP